MAYVECFDQDLNPIGEPIQDVTIRQARKRINTADQASFTVPHDAEGVEQLGLAAFVALYDGTEQCASGLIHARGLSGNEYSFTVQGHAHRLKNYKTPHRWQGWNGRDLADVVRDHLRKFCIKRWNTQADWETAIKYQVDIQTEPGSVILQYEPHPDDPDNERPKAYGYIQFRVDLGENALSSGRILRWTEIVDPYVRITVQSRSAAETPELDNAEWGPEMTAINVGDIRENEVNGVPIAGEGRWVDIRINLYTEDQNSPRKDSSGSIVGYGFTPYLAGAELIWREPTFLQGGDIPLSTGVIVQGFEFERLDFLQTLAELCDQYGWEFRVRHDEAQRRLLLDLGANGEPKFGTDRTISSQEPFVIEHGRNATIGVLRDDRSKMANILNCFGAGEGTSQLYVQLKNDQSIADYGEAPGDFYAPEADTMAELIEAGQHELEKRSQPDIAFEVSIPIDRWEELAGVGLGDTITVVHPRNKVPVSGRIMDSSFQMSRSSRTVRWGLNDFLRNPLDELIGRRPSSRTLGDIPDPPKEVIAHPNIGYIVVTWVSDADSWAVRAREVSITYVEEDPEAPPTVTYGPWLVFDSLTTIFTHNQLAVGSTWEYQVAAIKNNRISGWSEAVSATVEDIPRDDPTPPEPATNLDVIEKSFVSEDGFMVLVAELTWTRSVSEHAHQQFIDRSIGDGFQTIATLGKDAEVYRDTQGLAAGATYTWRVRTISKAGVYSENDPTVTLTMGGKPGVPAAPTNLIASVNDDGDVVLTWRMVDYPNLKDYVVQVAENATFTQGVTEYFTPSNVFHLTGLAADKVLYVRVFARDRSGQRSAPSNTVVINIPKLLSDRVYAMYVAKQTYEKLLNHHFFGDEEGYFDGSNIKPNTVETQHLAVGAGSRNFQLVGVKMNANTDNVRGKFSNTSGYLILATDPGESTGTWSISAKTQQLSLNKEYFVYVRCLKEGSTGEIMFSETRPTLQDSNYHNFLVGMYFTTDDPAVLAMSYGFTYINGSHITTGEIDCNKVRLQARGTGDSAIEISGDGIVFRDTAGLISIQMSTQTGDAYFRGVVEAEAIVLPVKPY